MKPSKLRQIRLNLGMSQSDFAHLLGYKSRSMICRLESGERIINPRLEKLINTVASKENASG